MMTDKPTTKKSDKSANSITKSTQKSAEISSANVSVNMSNSTNAIQGGAVENTSDNNKHAVEKPNVNKSNNKTAQKDEAVKSSVSKQSPAPQEVKQTMKSDNKSTPEKTAKTEKKQPEQKSKISKLAIFALLIALLAVAGVVYLYLWQTQQQNSLIAQLQQVKSEATKDNKSAQEKLLVTLQAQEENLAIQFSDSANNMKEETQENIEQLNLMVEKFSQNQPTDWLVHEAEYLIRVASRTLWLEKDTTAAVGLLQDADARIAELNDPEILPIRQLIYKDIEALRLMPKLETEEVILSLIALGEQVQSLPLETLTVPQETENADRYTLSEDIADWRENLAKTWDRFLQTFVVIHSRVGGLEPILPAEQRQLVKENLSLKLQVAQWAASKGKHDLFIQSLNDAQLWITQYFDLNDDKNQAFINSIDSIQSKIIVVEEELKLVSLKALRKALEEKKSTRLPLPPLENNNATVEEDVEQVLEETQSVIEQEVSDVISDSPVDTVIEDTVIEDAVLETPQEELPETTPAVKESEIPDVNEAQIEELSEKAAKASEAA